MKYINVQLIMKFSQYIENHMNTILKSESQLTQSIEEAIELIYQTFITSNKVLICGNGGSAADSQHMAAEFVSAMDHNNTRKGLPALALTTNTSSITAWANDYSYDEIFARQVESFGQKNDLLIAISTSGKSSNIINAIKKAKENHLKVLSFTGMHGIQGVEVDLDLKILSENTQHVQEGHIIIYHYICLSVEKMIKNHPLFK